MMQSRGKRSKTCREDPLRMITATTLYDGHDAAINIIRRLLQHKGVEVIHLGFNRSVKSVVNAAIQEDVDAIAMSSYQGGHIHYFKYLIDQLKQNNANDILVFLGGGGTISQKQAHQLQIYGVSQVYTANDGVSMGVEAIVDDLITTTKQHLSETKTSTIKPRTKSDYELGKLLTQIENGFHLDQATAKNPDAYVIGVSGTGGAGKSTFIDELLNRLLRLYPKLKIAYLAVDPSHHDSGGALLGDRIRINSLPHPRLFMRSMASRSTSVSLSKSLKNCLPLFAKFGYELVVIESAGIGQNDISITEIADFSFYLMSKDYGASGQLEKLAMLRVADAVILNKADQTGAEDAFNAIKKQWLFNHYQHLNLDSNQHPISVFPVVANRNSLSNMTSFLPLLIDKLPFDYVENEFDEFHDKPLKWHYLSNSSFLKNPNYLSDICKTKRSLNKAQNNQLKHVKKLEHYYYVLKRLSDPDLPTLLQRYPKSNIEKAPKYLRKIRKRYNRCVNKVEDQTKKELLQWISEDSENASDLGFENNQNPSKEDYFISLSGLKIPYVVKPKFDNATELMKFILTENLPGNFPFTSGVFKQRNTIEAPTRMFAGHGTPEDTNHRFHYLIKNQKSIRLSTAFDPNTLYGEDPDEQADLYACIGTSGVSVACLDDMKKIFSGIDLCDDKTSVSLTINGPAPIIMAWFFHVAIDQQVEIYLKDKNLWPQTLVTIKKRFINSSQPKYLQPLPENHNALGLALLSVCGESVVSEKRYKKIKDKTFVKLRGTLQADILKEKISQNECLFPLDFSMKLMADLQHYFSNHNVKKFYSVSISGYHIGEAGANAVTQLAFTLANAFTYIEYFLNKGLKIDDFAPQLSFFFSIGMESEYAVIGRVARRIWSQILKFHYSANKRSQQLKYHIQTSGRSLQASEIDLNDIRTTLQAYYAIIDNCNSLHTNAFDEAITTPTQDSVYRALSIQAIVNNELELNNNQNILQGSFIIQYLTNLVEKAVYEEFQRLAQRGGVINALEIGYQRSKIQQESLTLEKLKNEGKIALVGVNFFHKNSQSTVNQNSKIIRCSNAKKHQQIKSIRHFKCLFNEQSKISLASLKGELQAGENSFAALMNYSPVASLSQLTQTLSSVGGRYRRTM